MKTRPNNIEEFESLLKQIVEYSLPPNPKSITEICHLTQLGRTTVNKYRKIAKERGQLTTNEKGHIIKSKPEPLLKIYEDILQTDFCEIPTIKTWNEIMEKTNVQDRQKRLANLWKVCKTINRHPDVFLDPILEAEKYKDEFVLLFGQGKTHYIYKHNKQSSNANPKPYIDAIRSFRKSHDKTIPTNMLKAVQEKFDLYRKIKFNEEEKQVGIDFMAQKGQVWDRIFTIHNEIGPRATTLMNMQISHQKRTVDVDGITCEYYLCNIYESKQDRHFEKIVFTPHAKQIIASLPQGTRLHDFIDLARAKQQYNAYLREYYEKLGRIQLGKIYTKGTQEWFLTTDPSHAQRHSCVHWLMRCTGFNKEEVASMFWDNPDTLEEYNQITADEIIQRGTCYYCNPPQTIDPKWIVFCKFNHCLAYYNNGFQVKKI